MFNSWFGSKSSSTSRNTQVASRAGDTLTVPKDWHSSPSDASSGSQSTVGPPRTPDIFTSSQSDVPLDEVHASINDPSVYAPTPSLIQSTEKNDGATLRTSDALPSLEPPKTQRDSAQLPQHDSTPTRLHLEETLFTPQDAIIADVFGRPGSNATVSASVSDRVPSSSPMPSQDPRPSISLMTSDSFPPSSSTPTPTHTLSTKSYNGPTVTMFEPFSGARLGEHMQVFPGNGTTIAGEQSLPTSFPTADDRTLWSSLERILELQAEVAAMHADMEGVGTRGPGSHTSGIGRTEAGLGFGVATGGSGEAGKARVSRKKSRRGQTLPIGDEEEQEPEAGVAGETTTETDTDDTEHEAENADDEDEDDIHGYGKRRRDEEFAMIAEQFSQRKAAIGGIMNKLDDLSTALKTFHALPTPLLDLGNLGTSASHENTMSSAASSPPPFSTYPRRPSSPISSISPSQAGAAFTSPSVPIPPPVPPASTLAPLLPSTDLDILPGLAPVPPVLPRTALPTIITGVKHVESPADMHPDQSMFQRGPSG